MEKQLTISFLRPTRPDIGYHLEQLKPAFNGSDSAKAEWLAMVERVKSGDAGLYLIKAKGVLLRFVGRVIDGAYHINAMTGKGLHQAAPLIIERCVAMGYPSITYHTYRPGMGRILSGFGFELDKQISQTERRYLLDLGGAHG
ncbi:hypothetical protein HRJ45_24195 [Vibrio coralliilyticus]|uniref:hypothetical protein n=1 Tax=Vibrio coralliilyticus TaxID=190893 RepID=UPI00155F77F2|nr:hypothetical protein [Vibrio coralliilyticus]NRF28090.1 hypothetical protein [Vibrio coralliilyticus]NRF82214.1 hypothetical protein [Vibrio coralliilyticus]